MTDSFSTTGLTIAIALPWLLGCILADLLLRRATHRNIFLVAGHGYLIGIAVTTCMIRLWSSAGMDLNFSYLPMLLFTLCAAGLAARKRYPPVSAIGPVHASLKNWQRLFILSVLSLLLLRYSTLTLEMLARPLYAWDAWMNWSPKALVWYANGELTDYVSPYGWLTQAESENSFTLGNSGAWNYPPTIPLIQLWSMLGAQTSDHPVLYLPWLLVVIALGLGIYGHLRVASVPPLPAVIACYFLLSLPYLNVHVALAGYADTWLAACFGLSTCTLYQWHRTREWPYAVLTFFLAVFCSQLKIPGIVLGFVVLISLAISCLKPRPAILLIVAALGGLAVIFAVAYGLEIDVPGFGTLTLSRTSIELPLFGYFELAYHPIHTSMAATLFTMLNWNLFWYIVPCALFYQLVTRSNRERGVEIDGLVTLMASLFVALVFYLTKYHTTAEDLSSINRAILYLVPSTLFYVFRTLFTSERV